MTRISSACRPLDGVGTPRRDIPAIVLLAALFCSLAPALARAHPIHTSYTEADYRRDGGKLEIAIRFFTDDAEEMLSRRAGKKISVAQTPAAEFDALLLASVQAGLIVKSPAGEPQPLTWVGRELTDRDQHLWVYVVCPMPGGVIGARFTNRLLREVFADQINSVRVRDTGPPLRQTTLLFPDANERIAFKK